MTKYNPMSKEFQDECKRIGLTGYQLTEKYRKEGRSIEKCIYEDGAYKSRYTDEELLEYPIQFYEKYGKIPDTTDFDINPKYPNPVTYVRRFGSWTNILKLTGLLDKREERSIYTDEELLYYPIQFYEEYGRSPTGADFDNNHKYPNRKTYDRRFGSFQKALKLVELDIESMVRNGIVETADQKARLAEMVVKNHFENHPIDLAGENKNSPCDGICPNGKIYDVKSSQLSHNGMQYNFHIRKKYIEKIEIYYLLGFNQCYTKLEYGWRIPAEIAQREHFGIGFNYGYEFNIDNMKKYDITDKLKDIFDNNIIFHNIRKRK